MRARLSTSIAQVLARTAVAEKTPEQEALSLHVALAGSEAAAWLVRKHRRLIRRSGAFDLTIPEAKETPSWLRVALEKLRASDKWIVSVQTMRGVRRYRVRWIGAPRRSDV